MAGERMKKILIGITLLLVATFLGLLYANLTVNKLAKGVESSLNMLQSSIEKNNWNEAKAMLLPLENKWQKTRTAWTIFLDHTELDALDSAMQRIIRLVQLHQKSLALAEISVTRGFVLHIPEIEKLTLRNIF